ncbi:Alpha-soluble NSF attachment protein [Pteropus alecto]|uniref:Alpha-soluble NSF attachment protein n=1 Tax=Pteropus alecto TaxID=9402 RepID=L5L4N7_PTEAL|nr:Alpha-soluble NSF attachment protein [Pteropus alecto]
MLLREAGGRRLACEKGHLHGHAAWGRGRLSLGQWGCLGPKPRFLQSSYQDSGLVLPWPLGTISNAPSGRGPLCRSQDGHRGWVWSFLPGVPQLGPPSTQGLSPQSLPFKPCTLCLSAPSPAHLTSGAAGAGSYRPRHWAGALVTAGPSSRPTQGRFTIAAKHHVSIAEIYETELVDIEKAIAHYEQSADYYKGEESNSSANKCLLKVAGYAAQLEQYQKAIDIYEQVGTNAMDSPLLKYSAKDYFFKAALCHFCIDMLNAKKLLEAHEEQNVDSYTEAVKEYDSISRLDQWLTTMLLRIKKTIQGDEEDLR